MLRRDLQGTWKPLGVERDGEKVPPGEVESHELVIEGESFAYRIGEEVHRGTILLDPSATPMRMDRIPGHGEHAGQTFRGIVKLEGDVQFACFADPGGDPPDDFATRPGAGLTLFVMRRVGP